MSGLILAGLALIVLSPTISNSQDAQFWKQQVCAYTTFKEAPGYTVPTSGLDLTVSNADPRSTVLATLQVMHDFGLVVDRFERQGADVEIEGRRSSSFHFYTGFEERNFDWNDKSLRFVVEVSPAAVSGGGVKLGLDIRFYGKTLIDSCPYSTVISSMLERLPSGSLIAQKN